VLCGGCVLESDAGDVPLVSLQVVYKNNDVRLELSRLAKEGDPKMKVRASTTTPIFCLTMF